MNAPDPMTLRPPQRPAAAEVSALALTEAPTSAPSPVSASLPASALPSPAAPPAVEASAAGSATAAALTAGSAAAAASGEPCYPWGDRRRFNSYANYFRRRFGGRIQKLSIDAGFTCPNRDGRRGRGGCTFCNAAAFTPSYCSPTKSVTQQIGEGIAFHARRYAGAQRYLAYFQSYTNTYAPFGRLQSLYEEALAHPQVEGLVIGTRPDCIDDRLLDYLAGVASSHYVAVEYGIESVYDATLAAVNRGHDFACAERAVRRTAERGIPVGGHFILGLPGETDEQLLAGVDRINALPLTTIKFHQLQLFRATPMAAQYAADPSAFRFRTVEEYLDLVVAILRRLRPDLVVERFASEAPPRFLCGPTWGKLRNERLWGMLEKRLSLLDTFQGEIFLHLHP